MPYLSRKIMKYPISCSLICTIWILCFCTPPHTPLDNLTMIDKWTHIAMYLVTCIAIWSEYLKKHSEIDGYKLFVFAWMSPVVMSGVIEILQEYCTNSRRSGDWLDFAANAVGITLASAIGIVLARRRAKQKKDFEEAEHYRNGGRL